MQHVDTTATFLGDRYELGPVIGRGGMSEVHRALDTKLDRDVAVKVLRSDLARRAESRSRFEVEARAAAGLNHPNVVSVLDIGEQDGISYIVLERLPGKTWAQEIANGPVPSDRVRQVALDVLAGLASAHRLGVLHRDIKPSNILLTASGSAKLADFGIAKVADGLDLTATGEVLGTLQYMAPERLTGAPATPATDTYAVGVVLYEALTGEPPFGHGPPAVTTHAIASRHLPPVKTRRSDLDIDADLAAVVDRAVQKEPSHRFATATSMSDALMGTAVDVAEGRTDDPGSFVPATDPMAAAPTVAMAATDVFSDDHTSFGTNVVPTPPPPPHRSIRERVTARAVAAAIALVVVAMVLVVGALATSRSTTDLTPATTSSVPSSSVVPPTTSPPTTSPPPTSPPTSSAPAPAAPNNPGKGANKPGHGEKGNAKG